MLIGYLESILLRKLGKDSLKTCIELSKFSLRNLGSDFAICIYLNQDWIHRIPISSDFIVCNIFIGNSGVTGVEQTKQTNQGNYHQQNLYYPCPFGNIRFHILRNKKLNVHTKKEYTQGILMLILFAKINASKTFTKSQLKKQRKTIYLQHKNPVNF